VRASHLVVAVLVVATADLAVAKCISVSFEVSGAARDCQTGSAIPGAQVVCFQDEELAAWHTEVDGPSTLTTDTSGQFRGVYYFNTYSGTGLLVMDLCDRKLKRLTVVALAPGYMPLRIVLTGKQLPAVKASHARVRLPPFVLVREGSSCCPP
jgi:hypothetical protein